MEDRVEVSSSLGGFTDYYNIIKFVSREWLTILMVTLCSGLIACMAQSSTYKPVYRTQTTMVITATGTYNDIYSNIKSASGSAESFSKLLNSSVLRSMVAKEMGQERFLGSATAEVLSDSNLAVAMAQEGSRVILIDADFIKPALYKVLNMKEAEFTGLSDYLLEDMDFDQVKNMIQTVPGTGLECILLSLTVKRIENSHKASVYAGLWLFLFFMRNS